MKQNPIIRFFALSLLLAVAGCRQMEPESAVETLVAGTHYLTATLEHQASTRRNWVIPRMITITPSGRTRMNWPYMWTAWKIRTAMSFPSVPVLRWVSLPAR